MKRTAMMTTVVVVSVLLLPLTVFGASHFAGHTWRFSEIYSNPDGTIMFVELVECCGGPGEYQPQVMNSAGTSTTYLFPAPISCGGCSTAFANLLVGTAGYAALPGAPPPDFILPDGFFNVAGDTLTFSIYDTMIHGPVPTNGINSLLADGTPAINSPTNIFGDTGTINSRCKVADYDFSGSVNVTDLLHLLGTWGSCPPPCDMDLDFNGTVNVTDLLTLLADWGDCPPP